MRHIIFLFIDHVLCKYLIEFFASFQFIFPSYLFDFNLIRLVTSVIVIEGKKNPFSWIVLILNNNNRLKQQQEAILHAGMLKRGLKCKNPSIFIIAHSLSRYTRDKIVINCFVHELTRIINCEAKKEVELLL
jgi:hypothetical protein